MYSSRAVTNKVCSGKLCKSSSGVISSTYAIEGIRGFVRLRMTAIAIAFSNFFCRWRRDSAVYQAAPLRGFPLALGMVGIP